MKAAAVASEHGGGGGNEHAPASMAVVLPTGTKGGARLFSPGFVLPVGKPGLKGFPNREYSLFLY